MLSPDISRANNSQSALIQATKKRIKKKIKKKAKHTKTVCLLLNTFADLLNYITSSHMYLGTHYMKLKWIGKENNFMPMAKYATRKYSCFHVENR